MPLPSLAACLPRLTFSLLLPVLLSLPRIAGAQTSPPGTDAPAVPVVKPETTAESKPEIKPEIKADTKADAQPQSKAEAKPGSKTEAKPGSKADAKPEATPAAAGEVQKVQIKGGYNERRQDTASKTVITHEEIVRFGDTNLSDVLKRLPGVTTGNGIRLRGLGNGYTQILLNGEPAPPGFSIDTLTPDAIEKIEIVRAASAEFSTQAIAGTINIVTKKTVQTSQRELKAGFSRRAGHYSQFANLQKSDKEGRFSYTLAGNLFHSNAENNSQNSLLGQDANGVPNFATYSPQYASNRVLGFNLNPRLNWKLENGDTMTSQSFIRHFVIENKASEQTQTLLGSPPPYPDSVTDSRNINNNLNTNLNWLHGFANGAKLDLTLGLNLTQRDSDSLYFGNASSGQGLLARSSNTRSRDGGMTLSGKYSITSSKAHNWVLGWDGGASSRHDQLRQQDTLPVGAGDAAAAQFKPINLDEGFSVKVNRLALFGQDEWSVNERWSVYLGLRWEGVQTASEGDKVLNSTNRSSVFSPIFQTLWKLPNTKDSQFRLALARTYKAPEVGSLNARRSFSLDNSSARPDTQGNPNLRPELAWGLDLALEHFLADGGILSASSYVRRINDITENRLFLQDGRWVSMPTNASTALSRGIELEAKLPLRVLLKDAPAIDFRFNLTRNWSRVASVPGPDNRLDGQTPLSANLGIDYKASGLPLTLGGNFSFQSNGNLRTSATETSSSSPRRSLDLYALWKVSKQDQLRLTISDVLHPDYRYATRFQDEFGSLSQSNTSEYGTGVRLGLEHKF